MRGSCFFHWTWEKLQLIDSWSENSSAASACFLLFLGLLPIAFANELSSTIDVPYVAVNVNIPYGVQVRQEQLFGLTGQRIGGAHHPGPMEFLTIGTTNLGGMRNKEPLAVEQGCGIWSYAETQLSKVTQVSAAKALKFHASQTGISEYTMGHQLRSDHGPHGPARGQVWLAPVISRPNVFKFHGPDEFWTFRTSSGDTALCWPSCGYSDHHLRPAQRPNLA